MKGFYLSIDEFNTIVLANLLAWKMKKSDPAVLLATVCHSEYQVLFSHFDKVWTFTNKELYETPVDHLAKNPKTREELIQKANKILESNSVSILDFDDLSQNLIYESEEGIHKTVLVNSIDYMMHEGAMIKASKKDRSDVLKFFQFSAITKKPVVIIGRNREVHPEYNNLLFLQILKNLILGRVVVNATFPSPNLSLKRHFKNYHELPSNLSTYGATVALIEEARECVLIGNAGGIGVHLMTHGKLRVVGLMNWVNGEEFSYKGLTLFKARKIAGLQTNHTWFGETPRNILIATLRFLSRKIRSLKQIVSFT